MTISNMILISGAISVAYTLFMKLIQETMLAWVFEYKKTKFVASTVSDMLIIATWIAYVVTSGSRDGVVIGFLVFGAYAIGFNIRRYYLDSLYSKYDSLSIRYNTDRLDYLIRHQSNPMQIDIDRISYPSMKYKEKYLWSPLHWLKPAKAAFDKGMMKTLDLFEKSGTFIIKPRKYSKN